MKLTDYFKRLHELEAGIQTKDVHVVSLATSDGGKAGVITVTPKRVGCQLIVEGKARLANGKEISEYETEQAAQRAVLAGDEFAKRIQVQVMADPRQWQAKELKPVKE
jgi:hypothetical protein